MRPAHLPLTRPCTLPFILHRHALNLSVALLMMWSVSGCGDDDEGVRFGDPLVVRDYRDALNPIIDEVSAIEAQVQQRAVGSSNVATAANLNAVYTDVRPQLLEVLVEFDRLTPPRRLLDLHRDIRSLMILRLDAYRIVMEGYAAADSSVYAIAEGVLQQANELILDINLGLCEIDVALSDLENCRLLAVATRHEVFVRPS
jgi:hypothetical protein